MRHTPAVACSGMIIGCLLVALSGCSAAINPALRQDIQTAARVKTALVNDPALGVHPIQVRVTGGLVQLSGQVEHEAEIAQVIALIREVPGVIDVRAELRVVPAETAEVPGGAPRLPGRPASGVSPPVQYEEPIERSIDRGWLAVGASLRLSDPRARTLGSRVTLGPAVRIGSGTGLGLSIGFGWMNADLYTPAGTGAPLGRVRIRPVMAGLGYTLRHDRLSASLSLVGGVAINSLKLPDPIDLTRTALSVDHSLAWRPGVSLWLDANDRVAYNLFAGYLVTRPRVTLVEEGRAVERQLRGDTLMVSAGVVYKIF